ncbi:tRNA (adenosine(37)-N6)-dimethylallyltransferase MiaA [Pedobacter yulinensis]|uniref:tRNA dimethylallyltransferase n=1 Tax=Pedobacter yulinensis TaxID=2126353 RepID=A0A2T3HIN5_9SPHI|nr:tRNA (adenosine(37)-N6)-dimethylallyltransferase MiaA [Pedobacter yulinensis]PST82299.1 tRNA (adenosine(37)-N6)-dimethylallyltransferase MiaA [Pedobacter yulinensis]
MATADTQAKLLVVVAGPTAVGKTALAIKLARHFNTEIISADSRQFFREMSIGTAKPDAEERAAVPHHFIDSHSITTLFSTGDFENAALATLNGLFKKHQVIVAVGGSGLYINALCNGLDDMPEIDLEVREKMNRLHREQGVEVIRQKLWEVDPEYAAIVDQHNPQRMIRGLEVFFSTGLKLSGMRTRTQKERPFHILRIGLNMDRAALYERINNRVDQMMAAGLLDEVQTLLPYRGLNALQTVGYTELFDYLDGKSNLREAVERIKQNTRRFAKRQLTWFRKDSAMHWFEPAMYAQIEKLVTGQLNSLPR